MRRLRRGLFRLWVIATVLWEGWVTWDLVAFERLDIAWRAVAVFAILLPLAVLAFGRALLWAVAGFQAEVVLRKPGPDRNPLSPSTDGALIRYLIFHRLTRTLGAFFFLACLFFALLALACLFVSDWNLDCRLDIDRTTCLSLACRTVADLGLDPFRVGERFIGYLAAVTLFGAYLSGTYLVVAYLAKAPEEPKLIYRRQQPIADTRGLTYNEADPTC